MGITMRFPKGKAKALTFSYDDAVRQDKRLVALFDEYGVKGTFNINTGCFGADDPQQISSGKGRMSLREVKELFAESPHEVAVHAYSHPNLVNLEEDGVRAEILTDKRNIEDIFGAVTRGAAYPYGTYNDSVVKTLKECGIAYCRTTHSTESFTLPDNWLTLHSTCHHNCCRLTELAHRFTELSVENDEAPAMFYVWGHSYEFDNDDNWWVMEDLLKVVSRRQDTWYATNIEIFDYTVAYNSLVFSADGGLVYNPSATEVWFTADGSLCSVAPGQTVKI